MHALVTQAVVAAYKPALVLAGQTDPNAGQGNGATPAANGGDVVSKGLGTVTSWMTKAFILVVGYMVYKTWTKDSGSNANKLLTIALEVGVAFILITNPQIVGNALSGVLHALGL